MKQIKLDKEEKELLKSLESGKFKSVRNLSQAKKDAVLAAKNTLRLLGLKSRTNEVQL